MANNTAESKKFVQAARRQLREQVAGRLEQVLRTDSAALCEKESALRDLRQAIAQTSKPAVVDRVAYTWCDRQIAAEKLAERHVYVWKPNPSLICSPRPDFDSAEKAIRETLEIARGCNLVIVMKDTSTFHQEPWRLTRWTDIASRLASGALK